MKDKKSALVIYDIKVLLKDFLELMTKLKNGINMHTSKQAA